jgi:type I restriction enzyme R subunit
MEYNHEQAVADGVNVDFDVYRILTEITEKGSKVDAGLYVDKRNRETREVTQQRLDEPLTYGAENLDRDVVAKDQIRKVVRTFKEKLPTEIFPGRKAVPKTLVYAKDDSHAEDIVEVVREEFGRGNEFCQKITYKTTGAKPEDLIQAFRNSFNPRIVVTVDMIATGTDIRPLEIVMFLRAVKSRTFFEQMKGRGVRIISPSDLRAVSGDDAAVKDRFVIVDCVGACESELSDTFSLDREPNTDLEKVFTSLDKAMKQVAFGAVGEAIASTLAGKLSRLDRRLSEEQREVIRQASEGQGLKGIAGGIVRALDPDVQVEAARTKLKLPPEAAPPSEAVKEAKEELLREALKPLAANPTLREKILEVKKRAEQVIDNVSQDKLVEAGFSGDAKEHARTLVRNFEQFIREHKDEITALQVLYAKPHTKHLTFEDVKVLADAISAPPRQWTPEVLWRAYETLEKDRVKGSSQRRLLTDLVSLVRFALKQEQVLEPFPEHIHERFEEWLKGQESNGRKFTPEQRAWLEMMRDHVAASLLIEAEDFDLAPFNQKGGLGRASVVFGKELTRVIEELNGVLAE